MNSPNQKRKFSLSRTGQVKELQHSDDLQLL